MASFSFMSPKSHTTPCPADRSTPAKWPQFSTGSRECLIWRTPLLALDEAQPNNVAINLDPFGTHRISGDELALLKIKKTLHLIWSVSSFATPTRAQHDVVSGIRGSDEEVNIGHASALA